MRFDRDTMWSWLYLAAMACGAIYLLKDVSPAQLGLGVGAGTAAIGLVCLLVGVCYVVFRLFQRALPPPPLWSEPRQFSALSEPELIATLQPRLDKIAQDGRATLWQDRQTGQLWSAFAWDFEFTEDTVFTPISQRSEWSGMQGDGSRSSDGGRTEG